MKLSTASLIVILAAMFGCEQNSFENDLEKKSVGAKEEVQQDKSEDAVASDDVADTSTEEEPEAEEEAPVAVTPFTQADMLAMDSVVVISMADSATTAKYYSDVGRTALTTQALINQAGYQLGAELTAGTPFQVKNGQTMIFCNHPASVESFRAHGGGGASAFNHWPNNKVLAAGECFEANGDVVAGTVGANPGNGFYNHDQGNGNAGGTAIFVDILAQ